jgi:uncharacterized damage-inducible protein DinB
MDSRVDDEDSNLPVRQFGWQDMWTSPENDPRVQQTVQGERNVLLAYLRDYRSTLEMKCSGLDAQALARRSVPPSTLSLLGLIRHMTEVERAWFRRAMAGQDAPSVYRTPESPDGDHDGAVADPAVVELAWRNWRAEIAFADEFVANAPSLDITGTTKNGQSIELREILVHMIDEYARHCGHADLLRERIDGRVGQ